MMYIKRTLNPDSSREMSVEDTGLESHYKHGISSSYFKEQSGCVRFACVLRQRHAGHFHISGKEFKKKAAPELRAGLKHNNLGITFSLCLQFPENSFQLQKYF